MMSGVTHNRALPPDDRPVVLPELEFTFAPDTKWQAARLARHAAALKEREIYITGLKRGKIKTGDRTAWEKRVRELTLELLQIELELGL